jgi:hypothetical protein
MPSYFPPIQYMAEHFVLRISGGTLFVLVENFPGISHLLYTYAEIMSHTHPNPLQFMIYQLPYYATLHSLERASEIKQKII